MNLNLLFSHLFLIKFRLFFGGQVIFVETKKQDAMCDDEVKDKARAALEYCKYASEYTAENEGKSWKYVLIPPNAVQTNMSFSYLVTQYELKEV